MKGAGSVLPGWLVVGTLLGICGSASGVRDVPSTRLAMPMIIDTRSTINVNNDSMFVTNQGGFAYNMETSEPGLFFPRAARTKTVVYAGGLWFGSKVGGDVRVAVAEYSLEYQPGRMLKGEECKPGKPDTLCWEDPADARFRVYKIGRDPEYSADSLAWPVQDGAPVDAQGRPLLLGDQTLWSVYNDADPSYHTNTAGSTAPQNIEVQQTTFGFAREGPLGDMIFMKFKIKNRGFDRLDDCYVSIWSDPDLGGFTDDLVGSDTLLSLGYCYNANNNDELYGRRPPSVGYDFFQGPMVPSPGDTAHAFGRVFPNKRNLPMTSFNKYVNGTDPHSSLQTYRLMQGLSTDGLTLIDPTTGRKTRFSAPGDPVAGSGWLDTNPGDRRLMLSSGPFTMAPGDSQEVVVAIIIAQGRDRLSSVTLLKLYDLEAQTAFNENFVIPSPPPQATVFARPYENAIDLTWTQNAVGTYDTRPGKWDYHFEGYNLYQGESRSGPWTKIRTWDLVNEVGQIFSDIPSEETGTVVRQLQQIGVNSGLTHHERLDQDEIVGGPLVNYKDYYYAIATYSYDRLHAEPFYVEGSLVGYVAPAMESPKVVITTRPLGSAAVLEESTDHVAGDNEGTVSVEVLDPAVARNREYEVTFNWVIDGADTTGVSWNLNQISPKDSLLLQAQPIYSGDEGYNYQMVQGIMVRPINPETAYRRITPDDPMIDEIASGGVVVPPDGVGGPGHAVWHRANSTEKWWISAGGGDGGIDRLTTSSVGSDEPNLSYGDILMKWDDSAENWGWWPFSFNDPVDMWARIPFGFYERDPITGKETRLLPEFLEGTDTYGVFDYADSAGGGAYPNDPGTDWIYLYRFKGDWSGLAADLAPDSTVNNPEYFGQIEKELLRRMIFVSPEKALPDPGTVIEFSTAKPSLPGDIFRFRTHEAGGVAGTVVGNTLDRVLPVPNPFLNQSAYELNQFDRVIRFTNLPTLPTTIRIFNIEGELIRTIVKDNPVLSFAVWDLQNENRIPVASGIYIWQVETKGVGSKTGKMAVFVEKERLNRF